ncbi:2300_t:CDS:2, partial [Paraglomus occultum]
GADKQLAKKWEKEHAARVSTPSVHLHKPTNVTMFSGNPLIETAISGGNVDMLKAQGDKKTAKLNPTKRKRDDLDEDEEGMPTEEDAFKEDFHRELEEKEMELDLHEPRINSNRINNISGSVDWDGVLKRWVYHCIELSCSPLYYYLIDHSGFHGPTS